MPNAVRSPHSEPTPQAKIDLQMAVDGHVSRSRQSGPVLRPYAGPKIVLSHRSAKNKITTIQDAKDLRIGVPRGATQDKAITAALGDIPNIRRFDDDASNMQALGLRPG